MPRATAMKPQVMGTPGLVGLPWDLRPRAMQLCDRAGQDPGLQLLAQWAPQDPTPWSTGPEPW